MLGGGGSRGWFVIDYYLCNLYIYVYIYINTLSVAWVSECVWECACHRTVCVCGVSIRKSAQRRAGLPAGGCLILIVLCVFGWGFGGG